jgi:hypothetical protein
MAAAVTNSPYRAASMRGKRPWMAMHITQGKLCKGVMASNDAPQSSTSLISCALTPMDRWLHVLVCLSAILGA